MTRASDIETTLGVLLARLRIREAGFAAVSFDATGSLMDEEAAIINGAGARRRAEFIAGRLAARAALTAAGGPAAAIGRGPLGEPLWPAGYAGAITHEGDMAAAVAYPSASGLVWLAIDLAGRGCDAGYLEAMDAISSPGEEWLRLEDEGLAAQVFSAKEAAAKILMPLRGRLVSLAELEATRHKHGFRISERSSGITLEVATHCTGSLVISAAFSEACRLAAR